MRLLARAWRRVRALIERDATAHEIDRELRLHVDLLAEEHERAGMSPEEARRAALRRFGNPRALIERGMDVRGAGVLEATLADLQHTTRGLVRNPAFTVAVVLTLALAIGAATAALSVVHSVLWRWPYPDAERLVRVSTMGWAAPQGNQASVPSYLEWKRASTVFDAVEAYAFGAQPIDGNPDDRAMFLRGTSGLLKLFGVRPAIGRLLRDDDFLADAAPVIVLTHESWIDRFGGDRDVVDRPVRLGNAVHTIVGVAEPLPGPIFRLPIEGITAWLEGPRLDAPVFPTLWGRLRPGATVAQAQAEIDGIGRSSAPYPPVVVSLSDATVSSVRPTLMALLGATVFVLLIAVSNAANLFVARGAGRQGELFVRAAVGAGRGRLMRLLLTESLLLALFGGVGGLVLAHAAIRFLLSLDPAWIPRLAEITIDGTVLVVTGAVTVVCGLLPGFASMLGLRGTLPGERTSVRWTSDRRAAWLRSGLVATQVALSVILLAGSALTIRSYLALRAIPIGIDYRDVVTFAIGSGAVSAGTPRPDQTARLLQYRRILEHVRAVPGVRDVTLTSQAPLSSASVGMPVELLGGPRQGEAPVVDLVAVTEEFFEFFGSRAVAGRLFEPADAVRVDDLVVIDANVAQLLWPNEQAVGQRVRVEGVESEVIGISEPVRYGSPMQEMPPKLYLLLGRSGGGAFGGTVLVRHDGRPGAMLAAIQARVQEIDGSPQLVAPRPLADAYFGYFREPRFYLLLLGALGVLALVVATVGVYGVVSYAVTRRSGEIGIRMVLGARWLQIVALFCRQTMLLVAIGLIAGLTGAAWLTRYIENLLFGIEPTDPVAFAAVAALLAAAALVATLVPMRRALQVDLATTLRSE